jgi:large subunit ribosomal protein L35
MPKMKTSRARRSASACAGAARQARHAGKRHILTKRTTKNKRQLRGPTVIHETILDSVKAMLPYA